MALSQVFHFHITIKPRSYKTIPYKSTLTCCHKNVNLLSYMPRGSWWKLPDSAHEPNSSEPQNPLTLFGALSKIWGLLAADNNNNNNNNNKNNNNNRWVICTAFASLSIAALCEISIPNLLTASIFSAQRGQATMFYQNSRLLLSLCLASGLCSGMRSGCFGVANLILLKRLRETLYAALIYQDISFFDKETVGNLTSRLGADCQRLSNIIGSDIHLIIRNILQGTGALINLMTLSWPLALSSLLICMLLCTIFFFYGQYQKKAAKYTQEYSAFANEAAHETFSLIRTVRSYGTEEEELLRFVIIPYPEKTDEDACYTTVIAILFGGMSVLAGHVSAEQLMKYVLYCEWLIYAAWRVENCLSSLLQSVGASEKVFQMIALMPSDQFNSEGKKLQGLEGKIEFIDVSFRYASRLSVHVLKNVNISVQANEMVAIVGLNGSGKSTLLHLLLRLYEPTNGQILVDGVSLEELNIKWLRDNIGFVGQEPRLFREDVRSNISYGCPREITQEEIEKAATQAHAHEFILTLPYGYDTIVDDNLLSGGQKQRIAIARAIVRNPTILILDEATSALDAENEYNIARVLHTFRNDSKRKRTVIVIAHRLSTVRAADKIIVMNGGQVMEVGNHSELIKGDGLYARLTQMKSDAIS